MPIPDFQTLMLPILEALQDGQQKTMRTLTEVLADRFRLADSERTERLPSGQQTVISNRIAWAKTHLKHAGLLDNPTWGKVSLSDAGRKVLAQRPALLNCKFLRQFPSYLAFIGQANGATSDKTQDNGPDETTKTPMELLDASFTTLRNATADELLARVRACSPGFFEQVVVRLLHAMGYGGAGEAAVTGKSGDGGIDGVIKEDKLGLDLVCIQAKRWEASVGRPIVQGFVGSMDYYKAKKGVILTTSCFTKDASEFLHKIEGKKVVLIDGPRLAELMIEYNVGVKLKKQYDVKEVSNDFFEEDEEASTPVT